MFCRDCGKEISNNAVACPFCGAGTRNGSNNAFFGLNGQGVILFIVLLLVCLPLCWIPWVVDSCLAD